MHYQTYIIGPTEARDQIYTLNNSSLNQDGQYISINLPTMKVGYYLTYIIGQVIRVGHVTYYNVEGKLPAFLTKQIG